MKANRKGKKAPTTNANVDQEVSNPDEYLNETPTENEEQSAARIVQIVSSVGQRIKKRDPTKDVIIFADPPRRNSTGSIMDSPRDRNDSTIVSGNSSAGKSKKDKRRDRQKALSSEQIDLTIGGPVQTVQFINPASRQKKAPRVETEKEKEYLTILNIPMDRTTRSSKKAKNSSSSSSSVPAILEDPLTTVEDRLG